MGQETLQSGLFEEARRLQAQKALSTVLSSTAALHVEFWCNKTQHVALSLQNILIREEIQRTSNNHKGFFVCSSGSSASSDKAMASHARQATSLATIESESAFLHQRVVLPSGY